MIRVNVTAVLIQGWIGTAWSCGHLEDVDSANNYCQVFDFRLYTARVNLFCALSISRQQRVWVLLNIFSQSFLTPSECGSV